MISNTNENDSVEATVYETVEVYLKEALTPNEMSYLTLVSDREGIECAINESGRIVLFATDDVQDATTILSKVDLITDIGLIKVIKEIEVDWNDYVTS